MSEETTEQKELVEEQEESKEKQPSIRDLLDEFPNSPSADQVDQWKSKYGDVFCTAFTPTEIFIFRPLNRREWVDMQTMAQDPGSQGIDAEEKIVRACVLWLSDDGVRSLETKGGSLSTLNEQIMQNSNFMNPSMASALVIKL